jgi:hypothetical protein
LAVTPYEELKWNRELINNGEPAGVPKITAFRTIVSHDPKNLTVQLPSTIKPNKSNNCVGITEYKGRFYVGWRSAPSHFASSTTKIYIMSSDNMGEKNWVHEHTIELGIDIREPFFVPLGDRLMFSFFSAGTNPIAFQPKALLRIFRDDTTGKWSEQEEWGHEGEIAWQYLGVSTSNDVTNWYVSSYSGNHYDPGDSKIQVFMNVSSDNGKTWTNVNKKPTFQYTGGVSEIGMAVSPLDGNMYIVMRNEDGDESGFGSRVARATLKSGYADWEFSSSKSNPAIFESPRMFTYGGEVYLVGRRSLHSVYDQAWHWLPFTVRKYYNLAKYSLEAHTTALYRVNRETLELEYLLDLPGCGDTAFPSIVRVGKKKFIIANYSSPFKHKEWSWIHGQTSSEGTQVYLIELEFN